MKNSFVFNLLQVIFTLVGAGMLAAGYFAVPGSLTDDGFPLDTFFYAMGAFFIIWPLILFGTIRYFYRRAAEKIAYLKANGIKGTAKVVSFHRTNIYINKIPQLVLDLAIKTSLGEQFQTSYKKCVDPIYYKLIQPTVDLPVYVDPANRKSLYIDFEEAWRNAGSI
jgi:hypothetical protein